MNAPKRIWADRNLIGYDEKINPRSENDPITEYIRADIVQEMREALEFCCELLESLGSTALRGRSAIKLLEEE